ncbi:MAG TPA: diphthine--ammonia ligase [Candidatus Omnitrophota bacterium]|nr:diphthine--ammonia ligase [Candidatus Omnitrophota bacterium]
MPNLAVSSWSSGKDSCLACFEAMNNGYEIKFLLNFISKETQRGCFHGIEKKLMQAQAECLGIPLVAKEVTADMKKYEEEFIEAMKEMKAAGIGSAVFGDIYLDEHKSWVENACGNARIKPIEPLWNKNTTELLEKFIDLGFKAVVVSCQADKFGSDFVGTVLDKKTLNELKSKNICPCGENGEFHTFVVDGPIFKKRIEITKSRCVLKEGFWKYWFLDIQEFRIINKA